MAQQCARLFVFFGLVASGKSYLAKAWAKETHFHAFNSDVVRKELAGLTPESSAAASFEAGIYTPAFTEKTYAALHARALKSLQQGESVILDASYASAQRRQEAREVARKAGAPVTFVHCICPEEETRRRLERRAINPQAVSDAGWETYQKQKTRFEPPTEVRACLFTINTDQPVEKKIALLNGLLSQAANQECG